MSGAWDGGEGLGGLVKSVNSLGIGGGTLTLPSGLDGVNQLQGKGSSNGWSTPPLVVGMGSNGHIPSPAHDYGAQEGKGYELNGMRPPSRNGYGPQSMGWGGQAIHDTPGFKAPWFGKSRGRGSTNEQGNSGQGSGGRNGARGGRRGGPGIVNRRGIRSFGSGSGSGSGMDDVSIENLVALMCATPPDQSISNQVYQALFQLDGRSFALLLKNLAKSGMQQRCACAWCL